MLHVGGVLVQEGAGSRRQAVTLLTKLLAHPDTRIRVLCCLGCARAVQAASADPVRCPCVCREGGPGEERRDRDWHAQSTKRGKECERAREIGRDRERQEGGREGAREEERERGREGGRDRMSATPVVNSGPFLKKSQVKGIRAQQGLGPEGWRSSNSSHSWRGLMGARASRPVVKMWEGE